MYKMVEDRFQIISSDITNNFTSSSTAPLRKQIIVDARIINAK